MEEIRELIENFRASGMKRVEYCRQNGVGKSTLDRWLRKDGNSQGFVKVNIKPSPTPVELGFTLVLANGRRIQGSWQFGDSDLARLIRIAEAV